MDEIIKKIEAEGLFWAVCRYDSDYSAYVTLGRDMYIADSLADGFGCHSGDTPEAALTAAFTLEMKFKARRDKDTSQPTPRGAAGRRTLRHGIGRLASWLACIKFCN